MKNTLHLYNNDNVQVVAHRGAAGSNIPCNTIPAFDIALKGGASILEMDLFKSTDGKIFIFHTGKEPYQLNKNIDLTKLDSEEIKKLRLINVDFNPTQWGINSFDDVLEHFKGRCILNLDRIGDCIPDVINVVERHNMKDQVLLKHAPIPSVLKIIEDVAPDYMFMPIYMEEDNVSEIIEKMNINYIGAELVFKTEESPVIQPEYIESMKKRGKTLWGNAVLYNYKIPLSAGHTDDVSIIDDPDKGWGWLVDHGFDIIQTDWTYQCCKYLKDRGINH
ncbi:glycerophosphodiester phosphodiesterase family protein [Lachnoanaerobaculum umeaense]|uniref:Glycerophosphodiester phosphodiesterase n=1 Tax=Lachnoanaerobaculum umeaense TaxID=617123 RepID=A0A385PZZ6_9FIRM|nr:glycerophosphodiester phosphodiesterase family protein [Lachnoanaerobaculum umeaense]AYA99771.1 glycerophosphodiester phosphodiesterase [Lachnoanaerobaculum umeaense]PZW97773.1 glycerophosphoryl diester phosphodiesterase [Lachnoanaerobaculum umeaense]